MAYLGNDLQVAYSTYKNIDDISGSFNGSTTSFSLLVGGVAPVPLPLNSQQCLISVGGVIQRPDDTGAEGFRLSGGNIVFSSAPSTGEDFFGVILAGADYVNVGANFPSGSAAVPSITFDSDLDTGIYNSAANNISIATGGTQRLVVDSSGRLGLGTSSASSFNGDLNTLVVGSGSGNQGMTIFAGTASTSNISFHDTANTSLSGMIRYDHSNDAMSFWTNGVNERLRITSTGAVGIGTTSPGNPLAISQTVSTTFGNAGTYLGLGGTENTAGQTVLIGLGYKGAATNEYPAVIGYTATSNAGNQNGAIVFGTRSVTTNTAPTERARIDSDGRLLVGTSSSIGSNERIQSHTTSGDNFGIGRFSADNGGADIAFYKSRSGTVGTNTALQSGDGLGTISFKGADGSSYGQYAWIQAFVDATPGTNDYPARLTFSTTADGASSPTSRIIINSAGTLYPATDNAFQLGGGGFRFTAVYAVNGTIQTSDAREKTFVEQSSLGSDFIRALKPVSYKWKVGGNVVSKDENNEDVVTPVEGQRTHWGFIAQEVKEAADAAGVDFGGWILTDKDDLESQQGLRYDQFIAPLTKALQEALAEIDVLKAKVAALEAS